MFNQKKFLVKKNVSLKKYSSFNIGGVADYLVVIKNEKELIEVIEDIKKNNIPFFILGGGSNVLFKDKNFKGVVLKIETNNIEIKDSKTLEVESGVVLSRLVSFCLEKELSGLEWAFGIPGRIGGAVKGNAGAFGKSMKDSIVFVEVYDIKNKKIKKISNKNCHFKYRESLFKKKNNYIILKVKLRFKKRKKNLIKKEMNFYFKERKQKQPYGFSAGSIFKNYELKNKKEKDFLFKNYPEIKKITKSNIIPAGYLIESCNLKGKKIGDAIISENHANFIINLNQAESSDIIKLINIAKKEVEKKFKIKLEKEITIV